MEGVSIFVVLKLAPAELVFAVKLASIMASSRAEM
jgi:hypothetical protein